MNIDTHHQNFGATVGAGASFSFSKQLALRLEWERYAKVGDDQHNEVLAQTDIDFVSAGFVFTFE